MLGKPNKVWILKTLNNVNVGKRARIVKIDDKGELAWRLELMGFTKNSIVEIIHNDGRGPLIVAIDGSKIAIGRKIAGVIIVEEVEY